jgi:hypothetical protein
MKMVKTLLVVGGSVVIVAVLGLFIFFAVSTKSNQCCGCGMAVDNSGDELPPCCATQVAN